MEDYARRTWQNGKDGFAPRSDPAISAALADIDPAVPPPDLWTQFEALAKAAPVLVIRGEHSDLLSRETVAAMRAKKPALESVEIPGQGHAPVLADAATIGPGYRRLLESLLPSLTLHGSWPGSRPT